jgi:hypothetical protein
MRLHADMETSTVLSNSSASRAYRSEAAAAEIDRPDGHAQAPFAARVAAVARGGSIAEQTAVYRGLSLYPDPRSLLAIACEAVRSARRPVFEAIAHDNPYPAAHFGDALWNEMVVRALRLGSRLAPIEGLDDRRNAELADTLIGYVRERRAAHRSVNPEVWRCIGPFAADAHFDELLGAFRSGRTKTRMAAAIALSECPTPEALTSLESVPMLWHEIRHGRLWWDRLAA